MDTQRRFAVHHQRDGDGEHREAVCEIGRPIQRVNDPDWAAGRQCLARFLAEDCVVRILVAQSVDDQSLRRQVGLGDQIDGALFSVDQGRAVFVALAQ